jgi:hypothetical protein
LLAPTSAARIDFLETSMACAGSFGIDTQEPHTLKPTRRNADDLIWIMKQPHPRRFARV